MELMVAMALMAVLMGIGMGALNRPLPDSSLAVSQLRDAVRGARSFAMKEQSPSFVILQSSNEESTARILSGGRKTVGQWHFEKTELHGFPKSAVAIEGEVVEGGVIGKALLLDGEKFSYVDFGTSPPFDAVDGIELEIFIKVEEGSNRTLLQKGDAYCLRQVGNDIEFSVLTPSKSHEELQNQLRKDVGHQLVVATDSGIIQPGRFHQVAARFNGWAMQIWVDGRLRAEYLLPERHRMLIRPEESLMIGRIDQAFDGLVDEVRVSLYVIEDRNELPRSVDFGLTRQVVHFAPGGVLDPSRHQTPVDITLVWGPEARQRTLTVDLLGDMP